MIHDLTIGHLDPTGVAERRRTVVKPVERDVAHRLLKELGGTDAAGNPTLGGGKVRLRRVTSSFPGSEDRRTGYPRNSRFGCNAKPDA